MRRGQIQIREPRFAPGNYHTDGQRLLRIVSKVSDGALCAVEDCRNLDRSTRSGAVAVGHLVDELKQRWRDVPRIEFGRIEYQPTFGAFRT